MSSPTLGFGTCPLGTAPFGYGSPATTDVDQAKIFLKADGTQGDAALINPRTRDYVLDARGRKVGWSALEQKVYLALVNQLGSAADLLMGIDLPSGVVTADLAQRNEQAVKAALKSLTDTNQIQIVSVTTTFLAPTATQIETKWRDVTTGAVRSTFI